MKYGKPIIKDPLGNDFELKNEEQLQNYLNLPASHWKSGSGDAAIWINDTDALLFFKYDTNSYFIMELASYESPIHNEDEIEWLSHDIGGEPFLFSSRYLCDQQTLIKIILHFASSGEKDPNFDWKDPIPS